MQTWEDTIYSPDLFEVDKIQELWLRFSIILFYFIFARSALIYFIITLQGVLWNFDEFEIVFFVQLSYDVTFYSWNT